MKGKTVVITGGTSGIGEAADNRHVEAFVQTKRAPSTSYLEYKLALALQRVPAATCARGELSDNPLLKFVFVVVVVFFWSRFTWPSHEGSNLLKGK